MKKFIIILALFFATVAFAAIGHLQIQLYKKKNLTAVIDANSDQIAKTLMGTNTQIPEGKGYFIKIKQASFAYGDNSQTDFAFVGEGINNQSGIYFYKDGKVTVVADINTSIPNGAGYFNRFSHPSFDANTGQVAFVGKGILGQEGVYLFDGKTVTKMVDQQDQMPKSLSKFNLFTDVDLNNSMAVFRGRDDADLVGIYLATQTGVYKIMDTQDKIENQQVGDMQIVPNSFGQSQVSVKVNLANGSLEEYLITIKYVPY